MFKTSSVWVFLLINYFPASGMTDQAAVCNAETLPPPCFRLYRSIHALLLFLRLIFLCYTVTDVLLPMGFIVKIHNCMLRD